jgi:GT2 family glycosyltransferase
VNNPSVSVIIINWNHGHYLGECLKALSAQDYQNYSITLIDNASTDGSVQFIKENFPEVRLIELRENFGFSKAFNLGVNSSTSVFVLSLNPDVTVQPNFISELVGTIGFDEHIGIVAPKLLCKSDPNRLDSTGLFLNRSRSPYDRGQGEIDTGQYDRVQGSNDLQDVFGACGAAALYRRKMLEDLSWMNECMDEDFFAYYEDVDLAWRAHLRRWRCVYSPQAIGEHVRGRGDTLRKSRGKNLSGPRLALRNRYLMCLKNDTWTHFMIDLPIILIAEIPRFLYIALTMPKVFSGLFDLFILWPAIIKKREAIQNRKLAKDSEIRLWFLQKTLSW